MAGSRIYTNYYFLSRALDFLLKDHIGVYKIIVVSGKARGADKLGERWAKERGHDIDPYPADWDNNPRIAGFIRNEEMANNADALVAFSVNNSGGTADMIARAKRKGLLIKVYNF